MNTIKEISDLSTNEEPVPCKRFSLYASNRPIQHPHYMFYQKELNAEGFSFSMNTFKYYLKVFLWFFGGILTFLIAVSLASIGITCFVVSLPLAITAVIGFFACLFTLALALFAGIGAYLICRRAAIEAGKSE